MNDTTTTKLPRVIALTMLLAMIASPSMATKTGGVRFDPTYEVADQTLEIKGAGILRYMGLIKVYAGALYVTPGMDARSVLEDMPKRLEVEYFVSVKGKDFGPATYDGLSRNLTAAQIDGLRDRIDNHNDLYVDVQPGDRYALTYLPGKGTELSRNGKALGVIPGADFAAAIFSLWLGEKPFDSRFRSALLGTDG